MNYKLKEELIVKKFEKDPQALSWEEIIKLTNSPYSVGHFRKVATGIYEAYQNRTNQKYDRVEQQTLNLQLNKTYRETVRFEMLQDTIAKAIAGLSKIKVNTVPTQAQTTNLKAIGGMADAHFGKRFSLTGLKKEILNEYSVDVFKERMGNLLNSYVKYIKEYEISEFYFFMLGDMIDGMLRQSVLQQLELGMVDSVMQFSEYMAQWFVELYNQTNVKLHIFIVCGNHSESRPLGSKKGEFPKENMERIINWFIKSRLADIKDITVTNDAEPEQYTQVGVFHTLSVHGHNDKSLENINKKYSDLYNTPIDLVLTGHIHCTATKNIGDTAFYNKAYIQFPSIMGTDDYALGLGKSSKAGSLFIIIDGFKKHIMEVLLN